MVDLLMFQMHFDTSPGTTFTVRLQMRSNKSVAVITGAARGIGKGCALELACGFNLLINDRPDAESIEKLEITQQECIAEGGEVICFRRILPTCRCMKRCSMPRKISGDVWIAC
jgi:hypothetical protein